MAKIVYILKTDENNAMLVKYNDKYFFARQDGTFINVLKQKDWIEAKTSWNKEPEVATGKIRNMLIAHTHNKNYFPEEDNSDEKVLFIRHG